MFLAKLAQKFPEKVDYKIMSQTEFAMLRERAGLSIEQLSSELGFSVRTLYRWEKGETRPRQAALYVLKLLAERKNSKRGQLRFNFIDLFAGIGGLRRGFEPLGGKCVFTSEWNGYAQQTYKANFQCNHEVAGDITLIPAEEIPEHDVLLAGFPCQPFSIAGVSKKNSLNKPHGFRCKTQGSLFFDVARIIDHHRPKVFLLENVKNLVNHDKGRTFRVIHNILTEELGYQIHYRVIDARSWVPQHRERIFIAGFREANDFSLDNISIPDPMEDPRLASILHPEDGSETVDENNKRFISGRRGKVLDKYTLSDKLWDYLQAYAAKHRQKGNGFGFGLVGPEDVARTLSARYYKDGSEILIRQRRGENPRRLTPRECARLMGFDKPGRSDFVIPVSDTQAYKQFGNAVVVPVVETVARHMAPWIIKDQEINDSRQKELCTMVDIVSPEKRSRMMSGIRGKDTRPELIIRKGLHARGFRFRLHDSRLPGKPDLVFPRYKAVILVHGCFWHGHDCHLFKWPSSRKDFWRKKITRNREKDSEVMAELENLGWRILVVWECALKGKEKWPVDRVMDKAADWLSDGIGNSQIRGNGC